MRERSNSTGRFSLIKAVLPRDTGTRLVRHLSHVEPNKEMAG
ncbi:hypothetical protein [Pseudochelatococcus contaminans]|nr:hypothetical protein [Pseudochelatococcus contaminans]